METSYISQTFFRARSILIWGILIMSSRGEIWPISDTWGALGDVRLTKTTNDRGAEDGIGDGGIIVDGNTAVAGTGCQYTFYGTAKSGQTMDVSASLDNIHSSYVKVKMELYDIDRALVITSTLSQTILSGQSREFTLNMNLPASSEGHRIQLRFIRTDDGHTARNFVVDYVKSDGWYFPGTSNFRRNPDLPLRPIDNVKLAEIDLIKARLKIAALGSTEPTKTQMEEAEASFDALAISQGPHSVVGPSAISFADVPFLKKFAQYLSFHPEDTNILNKANLTVEIIAKNLLYGHLEIDKNMYSYKPFVRNAVFLDQSLNARSRGLLNYVIDAHFLNLTRIWEPNDQILLDNGWLNTDRIHNGSTTLMYFGLCHSDTPEEAIRWASGMSRYLERFYSYSQGTGEGIKPDGSGYHHWNDYIGYMYANRTAVSLLYELRGTSFQISKDAYSRLRDHLTALMLKGRDNCSLASMTGRKPFPRTMPIGAEDLKFAAILGGEILGLSTPDPVLSQIHNTHFGEDDDLNVSGNWDISGFYALNYSSAGIAHGDGWLVGMKGFDSALWGSEIYTSNNRYGRYTSYGAMEVVYPGGELEGNGASEQGFNWNYLAGTTTIVLPWSKLEAEVDRIDEVQQNDFVGSLSMGAKDSPILQGYSGNYGCFVMDFKDSGVNHGGKVLPNHNTSFKFKKSNFFFGDYILSLGSEISNDDIDNPTVTTLYQRVAAHSSVSISADVNVNGTIRSSYRTKTLAKGSNHWLIDNFSTGYYLPSNNDKVLQKRVLQSSPPNKLTDPAKIDSYSSGDFTMAYIDHGKSPSSAHYEYVMLPNTNAEELKQFAEEMQSSTPHYQVHVKNSIAHIVEEKKKNVWAYAVFATSGSRPGIGPIKTIKNQCLVMVKKHELGSMTVSVTNPVMGLTSRGFTAVPDRTVTCTVKGKWTLLEANSSVTSLTHSGGDTVLKVLIQRAASVDVSLTQDADGDGFTDTFERMMGSNPEKASSIPDFRLSLQLSDASLEGNVLTFWTATSMFCDVEQSKNLRQWEKISEFEASPGINKVPLQLNADLPNMSYFRIKTQDQNFP